MMDRWKSKVNIKVNGKNIERFIQKLYLNHIELLKIQYLSHKSAIITIYEKEYEKVQNLKTIYEIECVGSSGLITIQKKIKKNQIFLIGLALGLLILYGLSNIIFKIEIVHTNKELRELLIRELEERGIREKSIKKSFEELERIKEDIINQNRNKIEWLEIEAVGTKYVVRVEMRKIESIKKETENRNVVASKSAILKRVEAEKGEIIRNTNDYVKAGDVVISGDLKLNEEIKDRVSAEGKIYGEVWYKVNVSYPFVYQEIKPTGKKQTAYTFRFLNKKFQLFPWNHYQTMQIEKKNLLTHSFLPISFSKEKQLETIEIDAVYTEDEAIHKAEELARLKIQSQLSDKEEIISQKNLKVEVKDSKIVLEIFFTVLEDITSYQNIIEETESK